MSIVCIGKSKEEISKKNKSLTDIIATQSLELHKWYFDNFQKEIPDADMVDLKEVCDLLSEAGNFFVYFSSMHSMLDAMVKEYKLNKEEPELCKTIMIKRDIIQPFEEQCKFVYNAVSRICTTKIEANKELTMLNH